MKKLYTLILFLSIMLASYCQKNDTIITYTNKKYVGKIVKIENNYVVMKLEKQSGDTYLENVKIDNVLYCSNPNYLSIKDIDTIPQDAYKRMRNANTTIFFGNFCMAAGAFYGIYSAMPNKSDKNTKNIDEFYDNKGTSLVISGVAIGVGLLISMIGHSSMSSAIYLLETKNAKTALLVKPSPAGIGFALKF